MKGGCLSTSASRMVTEAYEHRKARCNFSTSSPHSRASGSKALGCISTAAAKRSACVHTIRSGGEPESMSHRVSWMIS